MMQWHLHHILYCTDRHNCPVISISADNNNNYSVSTLCTILYTALTDTSAQSSIFLQIPIIFTVYQLWNSFPHTRLWRKWDGKQHYVQIVQPLLIFLQPRTNNFSDTHTYAAQHESLKHHQRLWIYSGLTTIIIATNTGARFAVT